MDTIVALATARGRAGVAIIRVSGPRAWDVCAALAGRVPEPRRSALMWLRDEAGEKLDQALVLVFEENRSFTGDRVCEFHVHGGPAVVSAVLEACLKQQGVRSAEPGEYTRRAFLAGCLDLTEVEALADLIDAETDAQRRQAMRVLDGAVRNRIESWREDLLTSLAMIEAALDFADEELPSDLTSHVLAPLARVRADLRRELDGRHAAESLRDGFEVAILGKVNAGKSSLLNALAGREAAITSDRAGTTRDVIEVRMNLGGLPVTLMDTAGLRETSDEIESIGIRRGLERARQADLSLYLLSEPDEHPDPALHVDIAVLSKCDIWGRPGISARTGEGLDTLVAQIHARLDSGAKSSSVFSRARHFDKLARALSALDRVDAALCAGGAAWEVQSEELRDALRALDGILGRIDVEDVLGRIFSSFCIGK